MTKRHRGDIRQDRRLSDKRRALELRDARRVKYGGRRA
jgi:hypothetical protein